MSTIAPDFSYYLTDFEADLPGCHNDRQIEHAADMAAYNAIVDWCFDHDADICGILPKYRAGLCAELVTRAIAEIDRRYSEYCQQWDQEHRLTA